MKRIYWELPALILLYLVGYGVGLGTGDNSEVNKSVKQSTVILGGDMREEVQCEFDEPLKHITLIMHYYDTNKEMFIDYILLADPVDHSEIWGWSNCVWQPEDNWAACDIYVVTPDFVNADMNMDTLGHEVFHGACGDYHE